MFALDLLPIDPTPGVEILTGDLRCDDTVKRLLEVVNDSPIDVVLSDMAPNFTGSPAVDQPRSLLLCERALEVTRQVLKPSGTLLIKCFQGEGFDSFLRSLRHEFTRVLTRKPPASRPGSREIYLLARDFQHRPPGADDIGKGHLGASRHPA